MGEADLEVASRRHPHSSQQQQRYHDSVYNGHASIESLHLRRYTLSRGFIGGTGKRSTQSPNANESGPADKHGEEESDSGDDSGRP